MDQSRLARLWFRRPLDEALRRGDVAAVIVGVARFDQINDRYGHLLGDEALVHPVDVVRGQVRRTDFTVDRLGGGELVPLSPSSVGRRCPCPAGARCAVGQRRHRG